MNRKDEYKTEVSSIADLAAYQLLFEANIIPMSTDCKWTCVSAGNYIIELAEKIKAQRLGIAIQHH